MVSLFGTVFVFFAYIFESASQFSAAYDNAGMTAFVPFLFVALIAVISTYYHSRESFTDHFRLMISCAGFPALIVGIQGISKLTGGL
jgi:hypothetical protein